MQPHREEYITTIFKLNTRNGAATNKEISRWLNVAPSSVTEMVRKLEADGLVSVERAKIRLTEEGTLQAEKILSKHRLWELFLQQVLDYSWQDVHEQARMLQYVTSDHLMDRLNAFLNYPPHCPHGGVIFINDTGKAQEMIRLSEARIGKPFILQRIVDDKDLLDYIERKGLELEQRLTLVSIDPFDGTAILENEDGVRTELAQKAAESIFVVPVEEAE